MFYLEFLEGLHERLAPRTYLEIGVERGHSLACSRCPSIAIDPAAEIDQDLSAPVSLVRSTSDDYFAGLARDGLTPFEGLPVDLAYIDGMHHFEFALRDFIGVERYGAPSSVIALDDVFPRNVDEAARVRHTQAWTGDVFRMQLALKTHRPDLQQIKVDTEPTGTLLVVGLDPASGVLSEALDDIVRNFVEPDPQPVPAHIFSRAGAISAEKALALELWDELRAARRHTARTGAAATDRAEASG
jgi:hypothetical protein